MKISAIYSYNTHRNSNSFKSTDRAYLSKSVKDAFCMGKVSNYTCIFRKDIADWFELAKFIINNFIDKKKINVYSLGCSDGSEAFSLAIALKEYVGKKQLFPIIAVDKDEDIINHAKNERINLTGEDIARMHRILDFEQNYFTDMQEKIFIKDIHNETINDWDAAFPKYYSFKKDKKLQELVDFRVDNLLNIADSIVDEGNSFVACRNVIPYLTEREQKNLMTSLKKNLKPNSLVAIGNYDENVDAEQQLIEHGFAPSKIPNVFVKLKL